MRYTRYTGHHALNGELFSINLNTGQASCARVIISNGSMRHERRWGSTTWNPSYYLGTYQVTIPGIPSSSLSMFPYFSDLICERQVESKLWTSKERRTIIKDIEPHLKACTSRLAHTTWNSTHRWPEQRWNMLRIIIRLWFLVWREID